MAPAFLILRAPIIGIGRSRRSGPEEIIGRIGVINTVVLIRVADAVDGFGIMRRSPNAEVVGLQLVAIIVYHIIKISSGGRHVFGRSRVVVGGHLA